MAYSFDTSRLGHGNWGEPTATFNGTYIERIVLQAVAGWTRAKSCRQIGWRLPRARRLGGSFTHNRWYASLVLRPTSGLTLRRGSYRLYRALHWPVLGTSVYFLKTP